MGREDNSSRNILRKARRAVQNPKELLHNNPVRRSLALVAGVNLASGIAVAQSQTSQAGDMLCQSGLGDLVGLGLGGAVVVLLLTGAFRGAFAFQKLGQGRSEKKREGREQLKGAGVTAGGAFFPAIFGMGLDKAGIGAFSCIDWNGIIGVIVLTPF